MSACERSRPAPTPPHLGHLLGVVGIPGHHLQVAGVLLLHLERPLKVGQLVVKGEPLLLQALDDLLVRLADGLGLVVLDHRLVQPVLQVADLL